ncbi:unnamed protein product [Closterium sp. NIES-64]|nr:unnamed protein product [Closterium sp. NIES-64]CAI5963927.1 unnamed protein product [Closterium sp. NIES-65]
MEHRARSALRRFAALTLAAGLVALAVLVAPTTAGDAYLPLYFGAPSGTGIYLFRPGEGEDESSFKVLIYDEPSSIGNGQALCASVPQAGNRFAKVGVVRVRWDTSIGFLDMTCKRLTFFQTPRCRGRPYLALMHPDKRGGRMSDDEMQAMLTCRQKCTLTVSARAARRVLPPAQVSKSVKCEFDKSLRWCLES